MTSNKERQLAKSAKDSKEGRIIECRICESVVYVSLELDQMHTTISEVGRQIDVRSRPRSVAPRVYISSKGFRRKKWRIGFATDQECAGVDDCSQSNAAKVQEEGGKYRLESHPSGDDLD
jgi:hypothetical protein